jgi:hypothetical protein
MFVYLKAFPVSMCSDRALASAVDPNGDLVWFTVNASLLTKHGVQCVRVTDPVDGIVLIHIPAAPPWQAPLALYVRESDLTIVDGDEVMMS